ncbi:MAG TPA: hypothetical protein VGK74_21705 [Symbiobacteriaceae bacterium]
MPNDGKTTPWQRLAGKIAPEVLVAPKTCGAPGNEGEWPEVEESVVVYLEHNVVGNPWADHLALAALVMTARRLQANTVLNVLKYVAPRFRELFGILGYELMEDWNATEVFRAYLSGQVLPEDSLNTKSDTWKKYNTAAIQVDRWLKSLPPAERRLYEPFSLPIPDKGQLHWVGKLSGDAQQKARKARKAATDAVVPSLPAIRAMAQLRLNRLARVRQAYHDAMKELQSGKPFTLPISYCYDESEEREQGIPPQERLHFRIWDRRSFVFAHKDKYSPHSVKAATTKTGAYSDGQNRLFLEFVHAEHLVGDGPAEGLWFEELLRRGLLGNGPRHGTEEEVHAKQEYVRAWGYGDDEKPEALTTPFHGMTAGLLTWPKAEALFMSDAQRAAEGVLIPIEPLYAAAMFGLLALDTFTTTGMRINEAMQIRMTPECLKRVTQPAPPGASDQGPRERVCLMLIPKGERRDEPHPYYIGTEQIRLMRMTMQMLQDHYGLTVKDNLREVNFDSQNARSFRFKNKQPYLFQYSGRHLRDIAITACMKFILHGMAFKTQEGGNVVVTAHTLRHCFATHAVQVLKIPKDVVREWLQQKDIEVTDYYSQPTDSMIAEHHDQLLMRFAANVNLGKQVLRAPEEQVRLYEDAAGKAGTLADVEGGHCVSHGFCAAKFACVGCAGKVVDPTKRYQVERKKEWARMQLDFCRAEGLMPEVSRLEQLLRDCDAELAEMDMMEQYRRDGTRVAFIRLDNLDAAD